MIFNLFKKLILILRIGYIKLIKLVSNGIYIVTKKKFC